MTTHTATTATGLLVLALLGGCGSSNGKLDLNETKQATPPSATEQAWRQRVRAFNPEHPTVPEKLLARTRTRLAHTVAASGGSVVRLSFAATNNAALELVIASSASAHYLKHGLPTVTRALSHTNDLYLAVVDPTGKRVFEWTHAANGGSLWVRPGLERCSPVVAIGWPSKLPQCPST